MSSSATPTSLLRKPEVLKRTGLKSSQIDTLEKRGVFPKRVTISADDSRARAVAWVEREIDDYIRARIEARDRTPQSAAVPPQRTDAAKVAAAAAKSA